VACPGAEPAGSFPWLRRAVSWVAGSAGVGAGQGLLSSRWGWMAVASWLAVARMPVTSSDGRGRGPSAFCRHKIWNIEA